VNQIRHPGTIPQMCWAIGLFSQLRHISTVGKYQCNISSTCLHNMVNFGPLTTEIVWRLWAPQQISTGFRSWFCYCTDVAQQRSTKLCTMFGRFLDWLVSWSLTSLFSTNMAISETILDWYTMYTFWRLVPTNEILPGAKFTLGPSLAFSYIASVTARYSSSAWRQPNFAA